MSAGGSHQGSISASFLRVQLVMWLRCPQPQCYCATHAGVRMPIELTLGLVLIIQSQRAPGHVAGWGKLDRADDCWVLNSTPALSAG